MESSARQEYPAMLDTLEPSRAVEVLNDRMRHVGTLNSQIGNWLQERRRIEETYVANLRKLAQRQPPDDSSELGIFTTPWQKITSSTSSLAESHQNLASRLEVEIERPLQRYASSDRQVQNMSNMQSNLQALAKEYDAAQRKADRLNQRASRSDNNKIAGASSDFEQASSQWTSQAPYVFEALQALDESRCNNLRDLLTQYQTLEVDVVQKNRKTAENVLNSLLNVETSNEIKTFAARNAGSTGRASSGRRPSSSARRPSRPGQSSFSNSVGSNAAPPIASLAPPPSRTEELARQPSPSGGGEEKKSRLSGLRRLGTVVSRRKSYQPPADRQKPTKNSSTSNLGSSVMSNGDDYTPTRIRTSDREVQMERPSDPLGDVRPPSGSPPRDRNRGLSSVSENRETSSKHPQRQSSRPNGVPQLQEPVQQQSTGFMSGYEMPAANKDQDGFAVPPPASDPISQAQQESAGFGGSTSSQPRAFMRDAPIAEDQQTSQSAMASTVAALRQSGPPRRPSTQRGRRDIRNSTFTPPAEPLSEEQTFSQSVGSQQLAPVVQAFPSAEQARTFDARQQTSATQAQMPATPSSYHPPTNTTQAPIPSPPTSYSPPTNTAETSRAAAAAAAPSSNSPPIFPTPFVSALHSGQPSTTSSTNLAAPTQHRPPTADASSSDAASIRSTSTLNHSLQHPHPTTPGLHASLIETISTWQTAGTVTRSAIIGELALTHIIDPSAPPVATNTAIRLENFATLEKVAPNPAFVSAPSSTSSPDGASTAGEYTLDLTLLSRPTVAFKYQVLPQPSGTASAPPLLLTPAWRIEPTQTSVILTYAPNPAITQEIRLSNVVLAIHLGEAVGKANACMSKPAGTFNKDRGVVYWKLDEVTLGPDTPAQKLLARFATGGQGTEGRVEAKWECRLGDDVGGARDGGIDVGAGEGGAGGGSGALGSGLGVSRFDNLEADPFADEAGGVQGRWVDVGVARRIVSGTYVAS